MKIAQVAPLFESVPPKFYGGTERVVSYLTEELVSKGHEVTLFASGDSSTSAILKPYCPEAIRLSKLETDWLPLSLAMLEELRRTATRFDVIHFHIDYCQYPMFADCPVPVLTTLHGRQDLPGLEAFFRTFPAMPLVTISNAQGRPIPRANIAATVMHGLPIDMLAPTFEPRGGYLAFLGRVSPEKGFDRAIEIANAVGMPLKVAAKVERADEAYFRPLLARLEQQGGEYIGEINEYTKQSFLGEAAALLFPIDWPEPFGLVMIEAMACGTPVLAFRCGSVPEVIEDGITGMMVDNVPDAICALPGVMRLNRRRVRERFEQRFTASRMADDYLSLYDSLGSRRVVQPIWRPAGRTVGIAGA